MRVAINLLLIVKLAGRDRLYFGGLAKMNEQRLCAYLNLIQALLTCADGEEWNILHQHEKLVNTEFVQVMQQVAQQMVNDGEVESAKFLYYWVGQLNHVLSPTANYHQDNERLQAYLNLIQALLNCTNGQEGEVLAANQDLVDSRFVHLLKQVARQMAGRGANNTAVYLSNLATQISRNLAQQADILKPKFERETQIKYPVNNEQAQEVKHFKELLSRLNNNSNHHQTSSNSALKNSSEHQTLSNKTVQEAVNRIADSLKTSPALPTNDLDDQQAEQIPEVLPSVNSNKQLAEVLGEIAQSLSKLEKILTANWQSPNPLWYMEVLERAQSSNWLLTSEEIEKLIGVKPKCEASKDSFQRGCWIFTKAGKMGLQTAWRIAKYTDIGNS
ncbi:hypothetical protein NIES2100_27470 [Calothrix sp. NIES-2100]|uniref:hypothetical protein n=1 Tax=Calothrix sp. NIES-2100 TaxID=1954172 RepID=UPI000B5DF826|nr:hypothetical protein NIES2100_27470 [Calothrix sp. NIES-2100]